MSIEHCFYGREIMNIQLQLGELLNVGMQQKSNMKKGTLNKKIGVKNLKMLSFNLVLCNRMFSSAFLMNIQVQLGEEFRHATKRQHEKKAHL